MSVKRYFLCGPENAVMTESPIGAYIHYSDHERECAALREALKQILGWRELRGGANEVPIDRIEDIARSAIDAARGEP
jgi:hypothetical protein